MIFKVIPGFYGYDLERKRICLLPRGGSDITGSLLSQAIGSDVYENWTDVNGVYTADPNIISCARKIDFLTHQELRILGRNGAQVLHPDTLSNGFDIPLHLRCTFAIKENGTMMCCARESDEDNDGKNEAVEAVAGGKDSRNDVSNMNTDSSRTPPSKSITIPTAASNSTAAAAAASNSTALPVTPETANSSSTTATETASRLKNTKPPTTLSKVKVTGLGKVGKVSSFLSVPSLASVPSLPSSDSQDSLKQTLKGGEGSPETDSLNAGPQGGLFSSSVGLPSSSAEESIDSSPDFVQFPKILGLVCRERTGGISKQTVAQNTGFNSSSGGIPVINSSFLKTLASEVEGDLGGPGGNKNSESKNAKFSDVDSYDVADTPVEISCRGACVTVVGPLDQAYVEERTKVFQAIVEEFSGIWKNDSTISETTTDTTATSNTVENGSAGKSGKGKESEKQGQASEKNRDNFEESINEESENHEQNSNETNPVLTITAQRNPWVVVEVADNTKLETVGTRLHKILDERGWFHRF
jgi:hypothetical protein